MTDRLVTIGQFTNYIEANMARQLLADYGIQAVVTGENTAKVYSVPAIEGPELQVLESQAAQARTILESDKKQE